MLDRVGIFCYKIKKGQEMNTAQSLAQKAEVHGLDIKALLVTEIDGYIFIEGDSQDILKATEDMQYVRQLLGRVPITELENQLIPTPVITGLKKDDIVEIIGGPFKGSHARISSIHPAREEITVDLLTSSYTIPIVLHADSVELIRSAEEDESEEITL
jgi:transcriptional antiterminator NusG